MRNNLSQNWKSVIFYILIPVMLIGSIFLFSGQNKKTDVKNYSEYDKSVLMTCVNFAVALSDIIDVPVVDEKGQICQEAEKMIVSGEKYLKQINQVINS